MHLSNKTKLALGREEESRERGVQELKVGKGSLIERRADDKEAEVCEKKGQEWGDTSRKKPGGKVGLKVKGGPLETRPDSPGEPGTQPRDPCLPWRGILHVAHLEFPRETSIILRCAGKAGNPFHTK